MGELRIRSNWIFERVNALWSAYVLYEFLRVAIRIDSSGLELSIGQYIRSNVGWLKHI